MIQNEALKMQPKKYLSTAIKPFYFLFTKYIVIILIGDAFFDFLFNPFLYFT